jgi:hypothetical protein
MIRRIILPAMFLAGVVWLSAGETVGQNKGTQKPDQKKADQKKADDKKKSEQPKPKPPPVKPADPEPEETFDPSKPTNPLDLAHGLREQGSADLAVEYLVSLEAKPLPPELKAVLPLELARARLDAVPLEPEEGRRTALLALAKAEFDKFLRDQPRHPQAAEASLSLARVSAVLARQQLARAASVEGKDRRRVELSKVRPAFDEAARRYADAIKQIEAQLAGGKVEGVRKFELTRDLRRAELEHGVVMFRTADTYPAETAAEKKDRGAVLLTAKKQFLALAERDVNQPLGWAARAWAAECDHVLQNGVEAEKQTAVIRAAVNTNPAAREGLRMSRFFEVQHKYEAAQSAADLRAAREAGERWLTEFKNPVRPSPEQFSVQYYVAVLKLDEAKATGVRQDEKSKQVTVSQSAQRLLREAEKEFRALATADNDYADRAARQRTQTIRLIIGDAAKPPTVFTTFDECQMAAVVQMDQGLRATDPAAKGTHLAAAAALLDRALSLAGPTTPSREKADAQVQLVYAHLAAGEAAKAAALGESVARAGTPVGPAARAGALAVQAYLQPQADAETANAQTAKALVLADYLEKTFPNDPPTDVVRVMHADLLLRQQQPEPAYRLLLTVGPGHTDLARARLLEGVAAFWLVGDKSPLPAKERADVYARAVADLTAVPAPWSDTPADDARTYLRLRQQLTSLHLLANKPDAAIPVTTSLIKAADDLIHLSKPIRKVHQFEAERLQLMAVVAKAKPLADAQKYAAMAEVLDPTLVALARSVVTKGPAVKQAADLAAKTGADGQPFYDEGELGELAAAADKLDKYRRDVLVVLALQGRVRGGQVDQAAELVTLLRKLGGSLEANAQTLATLTRAVRDHAAELRRKGQDADADKLAAGVGALFEKIAAEPNQTPAMQVFLGIALKDLGRYDKACELLGKIPAPPDADLKAPFATLPEEKKGPVRLYRTARLELAKAQRLAGRFDAADEILAAADWAKGLLDFRRESNLILEARAAATDDAKKKGEYWGRAKQGWDRLANEYAAAVQAMQRQPLPADDPAKENEEKKKRDQVKALYFDLFADALRCVVRGNTDLLKDKPDALTPRLQKVADQLLTVETKNADLSPEVKAKFADLLAESKELRTLYDKVGGKVFTQPPDAGNQ